MVDVRHKITNHPEWNKAFHDYTKKRVRMGRPMTEEAIINRVAGKATSRALALTPRADITKRPLGKEYNPKIKSRWGTFQGKTWYAFMAKKGYRKGNIFAAAHDEYMTRRGSKGAIAAGFIKPIREFGTGGRMNVRGFGEAKLKPGGSVAKSYGIKARHRRGKMKAVAHNAVPGSDPIALPAMQKGITDQIRDMQAFANDMLTKSANKGFKQRKKK